jgi:hypothetical protein
MLAAFVAARLVGAPLGAILAADIGSALSGFAGIVVALAHARLHVMRRPEWQFARVAAMRTRRHIVSG